MKHRRIGLIINPIAGMGGKVALKGTDGKQVLKKAQELGAIPDAQNKAIRALEKLIPYKKHLTFFTIGGPMGEELCSKMDFQYEVVYRPKKPTNSEDTILGMKAIASEGVDLLLFAGGDGTARNIFDANCIDTAVLGIPAGVKIQSAVFSVTPEMAGVITAEIVNRNTFSVSRREIVDLDEELYRKGKMRAKLYGFVNVPIHTNGVQSIKQGGFVIGNKELSGISKHLNLLFLDDVNYAIGPGTTTKAWQQENGIDHELLGVDVIRNRQLIIKDATENQLWEIVNKQPMHIVVTPIGGQGFIFGRGNHQFSPRILQKVQKKNILVVSSREKLLSIPNYTLRVDTESQIANESLKGYFNVLCGYKYFINMRCT